MNAASVTAPPRSPRRARAIVAWLGSAILLVAGAMAFAWVVGGTDLLTGGAVASRSPETSISPTPRLFSLAPGQIPMPDGADCTGCHDVNGPIGPRPIPAVGHPIHGWNQCTECHSNERLIQTAPGHIGIHADQCLYCHRDSTAPAPTPLHPTLPDSDCLACHGRVAPLPANMADKPKALCWLCHHE